MPEGGRTSFEHELEKKLKVLDANIKVPEIPDAQAIFERAEVRKRKIEPLHIMRFVAAAAAVVLICVSIPAEKYFAPKPQAGDSNMVMLSKNHNEAASESGDAPGEMETASESEYYGVVSSPQLGSGNGGSNNENGSGEGSALTVQAALEEYFSERSDAGENKNERADTDKASGSFSSSLNKKRTADIEINDDSVSIMLYDVSGQSEILSALWVEGSFESAEIIEGYYVITVSKAVTEEDFESGYYMPMVGSQEGGAGYISESEVYIDGPLTEGKFTITVSINIENGGYEVYATLV